MRHIVSVFITILICWGSLLNAMQIQVLPEEDADEKESALDETQKMALGFYTNYLEAICTDTIADNTEGCHKGFFCCGLSQKFKLTPLLAFFSGRINVTCPPETNQYFAEQNKAVRNHFNTLIGLYFMTDKEQPSGTINPIKITEYLAEYTEKRMCLIGSYTHNARSDKKMIVSPQQFHSLHNVTDKAINILWQLDEMYQRYTFKRIVLHTDQIRSFDQIFPNMYARSYCQWCLDCCSELRPTKQGFKIHEAYIQLLGLLYPLLDEASIWDRIFYFLTDCRNSFEILTSHGKPSIEAQMQALADIFEHHFNVKFTISAPSLLDSASMY